MARKPPAIKIPTGSPSTHGASSEETHNNSSPALLLPRVEPTGVIWREAKAERNWLVYRLVPREGKKPAKHPIDAVSGLARDVKVVATLTYDEAVVAAAMRPDTDIGYLARAGSAMVCVDLDRVVDPETGDISESAFRYLTDETFTEVSPSGTGLHILIGRNDIGQLNREGTEDDPLGVLASGRLFFTVSLRLIPGAPTAITEAPRLRETIAGKIEQWDLEEIERQKAYATEMAVREAGKGSGPWSWFDELSPAQQVRCTEEMLAVLPPMRRDERNEWRDITFCVRAYPHLLGVWDAWSRGSPYYDARRNLSLWEGRERRGGKHITIASVIHEAKEAGWDDRPWKIAARKLGLEQLMKSKKVAEQLRRIPTDPAALKEMLKGTRT